MEEVEQVERMTKTIHDSMPPLCLKTWSIVLSVLLLSTMLGVGCIDSEDDDRIGIIVTILPQKEFAQRVGGDLVKVTAMISEGQDPHSYAPTTGQMKDVAKAELYFTVGSGVEFEKVWMDTLTEQNSDMKIVDGHKDISLIPIGGGGDDIWERAEELFEHGPFINITAGSNASGAPSVEDGENCHIIGLQGEEENMSGVVKFEPDEESSFVMFLEYGKDELNFTLEDGDGNDVEALEEHEETGPYTWYAFFHLYNETYTLNFGPTDTNSSKLVILEDHEDEHQHDTGHEHGAMDPHIWLSPKNAKVMVQNLLDKLKELDPDNADYYTRNANAYLDELDALDEDMESALRPHKGKKFLVYHPSFGYLAHEYGLVQIAIEEEGKSPTPSGIEAIIEQAKAEGIKVIFVSPQFDKQSAEAIKDEIDGTVETIDPLARSYVKNMREVTAKLVQGFSEGRG